MIIKELFLINFGKFNNKKITLSPDMNIIFGENEAGKSTVFQFIVGMFYGFYKPYVKKRKYLDIHEAMRPWRGGGYKGSILIYDELSSRDLRIERNFAKGEEAVKVFVENTGEEITHEYDIHSVYRLPDVASRHLGVSYATFINTLAVKQLGHETDESLDVELKNSVVNALSTHSMDVSLNKVQATIDRKLSEIGSSRRKTSKFYMTQQKLKDLEEELSVSLNIHKEIMSAKNESKDIHEDKLETLKQLKLIELIEDYRNIRKEVERSEQINEMSTTVKELKSEQAALKITDEFSLEQIESAIEDNTELNFAKGQLDKTRIEINSILSEIESLEQELNEPSSKVTEESLEKLTKDIFYCNDLNNEQNELSREISASKVSEEALQEELADLVVKKKSFSLNKFLGIGFSLLGIIIIVLSFVILVKPTNVTIGLSIGSICFVIGVIVFLGYKHKNKSFNAQHRQLNYELNTNREEYKTKEIKLEKQQSQIRQIIDTYQVLDIPSLISLKDTWLTEIMGQASLIKIYNKQMESLKKLKVKQKALENNKAVVLSNISELENRVRSITSYYHISTNEELKAIKQRFIDFNKLNDAIMNQELRINDLLDGKTIEVFNHDLELLNNQFNERLNKQQDIKVLSNEWFLSEEANALLNNKEVLIESINSKNQTLASLQSKADTIRRGHRLVAEIEEDLVNEQAELLKLEFDKKVYETIGDTITTITDELQHNFAPMLNKTVSTMVNRVTNTKYSDVKINPEMLMRLIDPDSHQMVHANQLSRGTMDLFYLALRRALTQWIAADSKLPIILDESFAHFDDVRLETVLNLFSSEAEQVLLFTCQQRELVLAKDMNNISFINL